MKDLDSLHVHSSWNSIFKPIQNDVDLLLEKLSDLRLAPPTSSIFRAFERDLNSVRCVIVGQDPYPTPGAAMGLAFSVDQSVTRIPASLRNIFTELQSDVGVTIPKSGDLTPWANSGVLLLNRVLTTIVGESNAHSHIGWQKITDHIARELGERKVVAILWGRQAQELSGYFPFHITGVHPSPLSAYRGFFGSKPFSKVNSILLANGREPINWSL